ncbi:MAG: YgfZ/GcvT domain-containing protein [Rhodocyclaceae bacterium]
MNPDWNAFLTQQGAVLSEQGVNFPAAGSDDVVDPALTTIVVPLVHLGLIHSNGADSAPFLHNLFSNDVKKLAADAAQWNSFNSPKGRMLANFLLWGTAEAHWLMSSQDIVPALHKKLSMYVLRSKVKLSDASTGHVLIGVAGANATRILAAAGLPAPDQAMRVLPADGGHCIRIGDEASPAFILALPADAAPARFAAMRDAGAQPAATAAWQLAMIRAGLPLITAATQDEFVAQMLNYELIGGVSFNKGCYPGQEIVARTQYLGKLKKRMYRVGFDAPAAPMAGTDIYTPGFGEQSAGKLVNVAPGPAGGFEALAVMQMSCAEAGEAHIGAPDGPPVRFEPLPYALP